MNKKALVLLIIIIVLLLDQALKIWVKTHFTYGESYELFGSDRAMLHFVENDGMAFGITFGGSYGKLLLSLFRILAIAFLFFYLYELLRQKVNSWLLAGFALIQAGALGNSIDSIFYGLIFSASPYHGGGAAEIFPAEGGYAPLLYGRVVDMFYFPLFSGTYPNWFPFVGGNHFLFFKPVFNIADVAITLGVILLLGIQISQLFKKKERPVVEE
ncbi:MAG: lipoprotein signal peptidase [Bacteroidota bacterium]